MTTIDTAKSLISFDTSGPPTREQPLAEWIRDYLVDLGIDADLQVVEPNRANVVARLGQRRGKGIVLSGHIDVVPPGDLGLWTKTPPFEARVRDGRLYGRGACDMKGPDACMLEAVKELRHEDFKRQLSLAFTAGEDTGGWFVDKILKEGLISSEEARFGIIPEPSVMRIVRAHKGSGGANVIVHGRAAHSSRPELGVNAIINASKLIQRIVELQKTLNMTVHPLLGSSTIKPTLISGGFKSNVIPDKCDVTLNLRLLPEHSKQEVVKGWIEDILEELRREDPSFSADLVSLRTSEALDIPESSDVVELTESILRTEPIGVPYYTEAVSYTKHGIPTIICGPGDIEQGHTPNEYITLKQLDAGTEFFRQVIRKTCM